MMNLEHNELDDSLSNPDKILQDLLTDIKKCPIIISISKIKSLVDKIDYLNKNVISISVKVLNSILDYIIQTYHDLSLEQFTVFIDAGVDPHYSNDRWLLLSTSLASNAIMLHLINNYGCDINAFNSTILENAIHFAPTENVVILLEMGAVITRHLLPISNYSQNMDTTLKKWDKY